MQDNLLTKEQKYVKSFAAYAEDAIGDFLKKHRSIQGDKPMTRTQREKLQQVHRAWDHLGNSMNGLISSMTDK